MLQEIRLQAEITLPPGRSQKIVIDELRGGYGYFLPQIYKGFSITSTLSVNKNANPCRFNYKLVITNTSSKQITIGPDKVLGYWVSLILITLSQHE